MERCGQKVGYEYQFLRNELSLDSVAIDVFHF